MLTSTKLDLKLSKISEQLKVNPQDSLRQCNLLLSEYGHLENVQLMLAQCQICCKKISLAEITLNKIKRDFPYSVNAYVELIYILHNKNTKKR